MNGIDVSAHNGKIDWTKVQRSGVGFAILRAGYGKLVSQKDTCFDTNYAGAKAAGIPVGVYWYSYATTAEQAKQEAEACISVIKGKQFEYPVFFDLEEKAALDTGKANCSAMVRAFCDALEAAGYFAGLYMSRAQLVSFVEDDIKTRYALWIAEWGSKLNYSGTAGIWQCASNGSVSGISGKVDLDTAYVDYPTRIKAAGLNGWTGKESVPDETIKKGDKGDAVKWLQTKLVEKGYLRGAEIDGDFGVITLGGLLAFQFEHGLEVDGNCGPKTKAALTA